MIESYFENVIKLKQRFNKLSMMYSVTSVFRDKLIKNSKSTEIDLETITHITEIEYQEKIKFDCELLLHLVEAERLINYYKTFHDEVQKDLHEFHYDKFKKLADDTLL